MLFLTHEKKSHELLREYLVNSALIDEYASKGRLGLALARRSRSFALESMEEYSQKLFSMDYMEMAVEIKNLLLEFSPPLFFQEKVLFDSVSSSMLNEVIRSKSAAEGVNKAKGSSEWLNKVLKNDFNPAGGDAHLKILSVETATGEEAYSIAIKFRSLISESVKMEITALESDPKNLKIAVQGAFYNSRFKNMEENVREEYFEEYAPDWFLVKPDIRDTVKFRKFDILHENIGSGTFNKYHFVFCCNLSSVYPRPVVDYVVGKLLATLAVGGIMFVGFPDFKDAPDYYGLEKLEVNGGAIYRKTEKVEGEDIAISLTHQRESADNRAVFAQNYMLQNQIDTALKEVDSILGSQPKHFVGNHLRGDISASRNEFEKSLYFYKNILSQEPDFLPLRFNVAALNYLRGDYDEALAEVERTIENLDRFDFERAEVYYKFGYGSFVKFCRQLKNYIQRREEISVDFLQVKVLEEISRENVPADVSVENMLAKQRHLIEPEILPPPKKTGKSGDTTVISGKQEHGKAGQELIQDKSTQSFEEQTDNAVKEPERLNVPARAMFLDAENMEKYHGMIEDLKNTRKNSSQQQAADMWKQAAASMGTDQALMENEAVAKERPAKERVVCNLSKNFLKRSYEILEKREAREFIRLVDLYLARADASQQEILLLLRRVCKTFAKRHSPAGQQVKIRGKMKEFYEDLKRLKIQIKEKNMLEASVLFSKVINYTPVADTLPRRQKERMDKIKVQIENKMKKYQQFMDRYYADPKTLFQRELWEALKHLTPPDNLRETGEKYGLDSRYLSKKDE